MSLCLSTFTIFSKFIYTKIEEVNGTKIRLRKDTVKFGGTITTYNTRQVDHSQKVGYKGAKVSRISDKVDKVESEFMKIAYKAKRSEKQRDERRAKR